VNKLIFCVFLTCSSSAFVKFPTKKVIDASKETVNFPSGKTKDAEETKVMNDKNSTSGERGDVEDVKILVFRANNEKIVLTLSELNRIFGKKSRQIKRLSRDEKKEARSCR